MTEPIFGPISVTIPASADFWLHIVAALAIPLVLAVIVSIPIAIRSWLLARKAGRAVAGAFRSEGGRVVVVHGDDVARVPAGAPVHAAYGRWFRRVRGARAPSGDDGIGLWGRGSEGGSPGLPQRPQTAGRALLRLFLFVGGRGLSVGMGSGLCLSTPTPAGAASEPSGGWGA